MQHKKSIPVWYRRTTLGLAAAYWCLWVVITHWPKLEIPAFAGLRYDKVAHFGGYTILAFLLAQVVATHWRAGLQFTRRAALGVWSVVAVGGILDELTQPYFRRSFEWGDYAADLLGGLFGIALAVAVQSYFRSKGAESENGRKACETISL